MRQGGHSLDVDGRHDDDDDRPAQLPTLTEFELAQAEVQLIVRREPSRAARA